MPTTKTAVATCIITDEHGGVMVLYRKTDGRSYWEFPGGAVHADEAPEVAIARELQTQMGVDVHVAQQLGSRVVTEGEAECQYAWFLAKIVSGQPRLDNNTPYSKWGYFSLVMLTQRYEELSPGIKSFLEAMAYDEITLNI